MARQNRFVSRLEKKDPDSPAVRAPGQNFSRRDREKAKLDYIEAYQKFGLGWPACHAAGTTPQTINNWRRADPDFDQILTFVHEEWNDKIREEVYRRAVTGYPKEVVSNGRVVTITERSDILLMFLAKSRMPEFRENGAIASDGSTHLEGVEDRVEGRISEMAARLRAAARVESSGLGIEESAHTRVGHNPLISDPSDIKAPSGSRPDYQIIDLEATSATSAGSGGPRTADQGPPSTDQGPPSTAISPRQVILDSLPSIEDTTDD
jgi:hypothetical protein